MNHPHPTLTEQPRLSKAARLLVTDLTMELSRSAREKRMSALQLQTRVHAVPDELWEAAAAGDAEALDDLRAGLGLPKAVPQ